MRNMHTKNFTCGNRDEQQRSYEKYKLNKMKQSTGCDKFMNGCKFTIHENGIGSVEKRYRQRLVNKR